jgi:hypothetical protein
VIFKTNIIRNTEKFMRAFSQNTSIDWRIGLVSTDVSENPYLGFSTPFDSNDSDPVGTFQNAVRSLGTNGAYDEYVFYSAVRAFQQFTGFARGSAHKVFIMVTDEEEQSGSYGFNAHSFINTMSAYLGTNGKMRIYGALQMQDLPHCQGYNPNYSRKSF